MRFFKSALLLACLVVTVAMAAAQMPGAPKVSLKMGSAKAVVGKPINAVLTVTFSDGFHGYQNPQTDPSLIPVTVTSADKVFKVLKVAYPKGTPTTVSGEVKPVNVYEGTIQIPITVQASKAGKVSLTLSFGYQQCNAQSCFPPGTANVSTTIVVAKASTASKVKAKA